MSSANNFIILNIREYLAGNDKQLGENRLIQLLYDLSGMLSLFSY